MHRTLIKTLPVALWILPAIAAAQSLVDVVGKAFILLRVYVIPTLFVIATVVFLWGIVKFLTAAGDEAKLKEGKKLMTWGILGLVVMLSVWGIVRAVVNTFGLPGQGIPPGPGDIGI